MVGPGTPREPAGVSRVARVSAVGFFGVALFQGALAAGVPWGSAAYGGSSPGTLPVGLRGASALAMIVWLSVAVLVAGLLPATSTWARLRRPAVVVLIPVMGLSAVLNAISPSVLERTIWTPVVVAQLVLLWTARRRESRR